MAVPCEGSGVATKRKHCSSKLSGGSGKWQPNYPLLYGLQGYQYCDLLIDHGEWTAVYERATQSLEITTRNLGCCISRWIELTLGRATLGWPWTAAVYRKLLRRIGAACAA